MEARLIQLGNDFPFCVASYNGAPSYKYEAWFIQRKLLGDSCYDITHLSDPRLTVDVGANIGLFAVYMKKKCRACRLLAFEPVPNTCAVVTENVDLHKSEAVETLQLAFGAEASTEPLTFSHPTRQLDSRARREDKFFETFFNIDSGKNFTQKMLGDADKVAVAFTKLSGISSERKSNIIDLSQVDVDCVELHVF